MKKTLLLVIAMIGFSACTYAQSISKNAIGVRIGDSDGFGTEISYQRNIGKNNRLEFDLGWRNSKEYDAFKLVGLYQWVKKLDGSFNWYLGVGGGLGSYSFEDQFEYDDESFLFAAGNVGVEYNFEIPLLVSLDVRPELGFGDYRDDLDFDIALGIKYQF